MSPRLASARTIRPASRARAHVMASAIQPGAPRRSKQATCGFTATQAGPAAAMSAAQCTATAAAARSAGAPSAGATATASGHRRAGSGSRPRTTCDSRSPTSAASRAPKAAPTGRWGAGCRTGLAALQGLLQAGARTELRHARRGDLDRLAGARMDALARAALGDAELAEAREVHLAASLEGVLDGLQKGVDGLAGVSLRQAGRRRDLIHEFRLRHSFLPGFENDGRR